MVWMKVRVTLVYRSARATTFCSIAFFSASVRLPGRPACALSSAALAALSASLARAKRLCPTSAKPTSQSTEQRIASRHAVCSWPWLMACSMCFLASWYRPLLTHSDPSRKVASTLALLRVVKPIWSSLDVASISSASSYLPITCISSAISARVRPRRALRVAILLSVSSSARWYLSSASSYIARATCTRAMPSSSSASSGWSPPQKERFLIADAWRYMLRETERRPLRKEMSACRVLQTPTIGSPVLPMRRKQSSAMRRNLPALVSLKTSMSHSASQRKICALSLSSREIFRSAAPPPALGSPFLGLAAGAFLAAAGLALPPCPPGGLTMLLSMRARHWMSDARGRFWTPIAYCTMARRASMRRTWRCSLPRKADRPSLMSLSIPAAFSKSPQRWSMRLYCAIVRRVCGCLSLRIFLCMSSPLRHRASAST
mmetsp:Transcript_25112/g.60840  ORF Transcript_25112/g.60840 Transcript_25112/m.60840 type:complete len:432 (-) Transcript_25112:3256-4551(-)